MEGFSKTKNFNPLDEFKETRKIKNEELNFLLGTPFQSYNAEGAKIRTPFNDITPKVDPRGVKDCVGLDEESVSSIDFEAVKNYDGNPLNISDQYVLARYQSKNNNCIQMSRNRDLAWGFNLNKIFEQKSSMVFHNETVDLQRTHGDLSYLSQESSLSSLLIFQR